MVSEKVQNDALDAQDTVTETPDSFVLSDGTEVAKAGLSDETTQKFKDLVSQEPETNEAYVDINRRSPENSVMMDGMMPDQGSSDTEVMPEVIDALKNLNLNLAPKGSSTGMPAGVYGMTPTGFQPASGPNFADAIFQAPQNFGGISTQAQPGMAQAGSMGVSNTPNELVPQAIQSVPGYMSPEQISQRMAQQGAAAPVSGGSIPQSSVGTPGVTRSLSVSGTYPSGSSGNSRGARLVEQGIRENANAESAQAQRAMEINKATEDALKAQQIQENLLKAQQQRQAAFTAMMEANKKDYEELMNLKVNPNRLFENATTGQKVLAGIGILLSGIGSGLTGQQNGAMQVVNRLIDNDIAMQQAEINKRKESMDYRLNLYGLMREKTGDDMAAMLATKNYILEDSQRKIEMLGAQFGGPKAQANAKILIGKIQMEQEANMQQYLARMMEIQAKNAQKSALDPKSYDSRYGQFISPAAKAEFLDLAANTELARNEIDKIIQLAKDNYFFKHLPEVRTKIKSHMDSLISLITNTYIPRSKKLSNADREFLRGVVGDMTEVFAFDKNNLQKLNQIKDLMDQKIQEELRYKIVPETANTGTYGPNIENDFIPDEEGDE